MNKKDAKIWPCVFLAILISGIFILALEPLGLRNSAVQAQGKEFSEMRAGWPQNQYACKYSEWRFERIEVETLFDDEDKVLVLQDYSNISSNYFKVNAVNGSASGTVPYTCTELQSDVNPPNCFSGGTDSFKYTWSIPPKTWTKATTFTTDISVDCKTDMVCTSTDPLRCGSAYSYLKVAYPFYNFNKDPNCNLPHIPGGETHSYAQDSITLDVQPDIREEIDKRYFAPYWDRIENVPCDQVEARRLYAIELSDGKRDLVINYLYRPIPEGQEPASAPPEANNPPDENVEQPPASNQDNPQSEQLPSNGETSSSSSSDSGLLGVAGLGLAIAGGLGLGSTILTNIVLTKNNKVKSQEKNEKAKKDQIIQLQLSVKPGSIRLKQGGSENVTVQSIVVYRSGKRTLAPASLTISSNSPNISLTPQSGSTTMVCTITQIAMSEQPTTLLIIRGTFGQFSESVSVIVELESDQKLQLEVHYSPNRNILLPDGKDTVGLFARVCGADPSDPPGEAALSAHKTIEFQIADEDSRKWLCESVRQEIDGWWAYGVQAVNLAGYGEQFTPIHPPKTEVFINITALTDTGEKLQKQIGFTIHELPTLDAKPDHFRLPAKSGEGVTAEVWINDPWEAPWDFDCQFRKDYPALVIPTFSEKSGITSVLTVKDAQLEPTNNLGEETTYLHLLATREGMKPLERYLTITLVQEGLFIDPLGRNEDGNYRVCGDGNALPREIDFRVLVRDERSGELSYSKELARSLIIENITPENSIGLNASQTGDLKWGLSDNPLYDDGIRPSNNPSAVWRFWLPFAVPGDNRIPKVEMQAVVEGKDGENFAVQFTLGIEMTGLESGSTDWQIEYDRCEKMIIYYVPHIYYTKIHDILESKSRTLGPEGMYELRKKIWEIAQELTLGEGGEGWRDAGRWEGYVETSLEVVKILCDVAFGIVGGMVFGLAAIAADILRDTIRTAIVAFVDGKSIGEWLDDELSGLETLITSFGEGHLIDVDFITRLFQKNPRVFWIAWSIFVTLDFLKNLYQTKSLKEAIKQSIKDVAIEVVARWVFGQISKRLGAGDIPVYKNWDEVPEDIKKRFASLKNGIEIKNGKAYARPQDVLDLQRDTQSMRSLKGMPQDLQNAFNNTLHEQIYHPVNEAVKQDSLEWVRNHIPGMKNARNINVRVDEFRTPGMKAGGINTDHDFRVQYLDRNGNWIEVDRRAYENTATRKFAEVTGFDPNSQQVRDMLPDDIQKKWDTMSSQEKDRWWSDKHGQLATDKYHIEASPDFSDQVIDPATGKMVRRTPNIIQVQAGNARLLDPDSIARMETEKIADQVIKGNMSESIAQAQKGIKLLEGVRRGYSTQGYKVGEIPNNMQKAFDLIRRTPVDLRATPEKMIEFTKELKRLDFKNMQDFAQKFGSQYEALKIVKK